jgi:hypothetical protein
MNCLLFINIYSFPVQNTDKNATINIHEPNTETIKLCRFTSESVHRWKSQVQVLKFSLVMNRILQECKSDVMGVK